MREMWLLSWATACLAASTAITSALIYLPATAATAGIATLSGAGSISHGDDDIQQLLIPLRAFLDQLHASLASLPSLPILIGHCVFCTTMAPDARSHFVLHFWLTYLGGFAGGALSSLLLMRPDKAPISLLASNTTGVVWVLAWWLMTYSPAAAALHRLHAWLPVRAATKACVQFMRASLIASRVPLAAALYPGVHAAPLLVGALAACGGKCTYDAIRAVYGTPLGGAPAEFTVPTYSMRSAVLGAALVYLTAVLPSTAFLTKEQVRGEGEVGDGGCSALGMMAACLLHDIHSLNRK
jgi:hypothetical protein